MAHWSNTKIRKPGPPVDWESPADVRARIERAVVIDENGCWIWQPKGGSNGYANFTRHVDGQVKMFVAHRVSYEAHVGPIPDGLQIDHLCAVKRCVNPAHLEPVTAAENNRRRSARQAVAR